MWKYIYLAAVEIEGGYNSKPSLPLHPDVSLKQGDFKNSSYFGEIISEPLPSEDLLIKFIEKYWPSESSKSSGYHIHTSFKDINYYCRLMEKDFYNSFLNEMKRWGTENFCRNDYFWQRLNGLNNFCSKKFYPEKQVKCKTKDEARAGNLRRTQLNYCYGQYKTLENRMFPTFHSVEKALSATKFYLDFIENFLDKNLNKTPLHFEVIDGDIVKASEIIVNKNNEFNLYYSLQKRKIGRKLKAKIEPAYGGEKINKSPYTNKAQWIDYKPVSIPTLNTDEMD